MVLGEKVFPFSHMAILGASIRQRKFKGVLVS